MKMTGGAAMLVAQFGMLVGLAWWGLLAFPGVMSWVVGLGLPVAVLVVWQLFLSPNASQPVPVPAQITVRLLLLLGGGVALWAVGVPELAIAQAILAVLGTGIAVWAHLRNGEDARSPLIKGSGR